MAKLTHSRKYDTSLKEDTNKQTSSADQLVERHEIPGTPFLVIKVEEKWFVTLGKYRLTEPAKNKKEAIKQAREFTWIRIMQVIQAMIESDKKLETNKLLPTPK